MKRLERSERRPFSSKIPVWSIALTMLREPDVGSRTSISATALVSDAQMGGPKQEAGVLVLGLRFRF
jgi:hypothetical protein